MYLITEKTAQISIRVLGESQVHSANQLVTPPFNFLRILTYLIIEGRGRPVARRRFANLIWSDNPSEQANADIRQAVARIRRFQEENKFQLLSADSLMAWINPGQNVYVDLSEFLDLIANSGPQTWLRLCEIYNGDLLGSHRPAGEGFEEWLDHHRTALRYNFINAIAQAVLPTSSMTHKERSFCASRLLSEDPYHEGAHRALMYEAAMSGDFSFLRHLFLMCTNLLRLELGVTPTQETVTFYNSLMSLAPS